MNVMNLQLVAAGKNIFNYKIKPILTSFSHRFIANFASIAASKNTIDHYSRIANDWLQNSIHITADKGPILKSAYLRHVSEICTTLPRNDFVLYFVFLPTLVLGAIGLSCRHYADQLQLEKTKIAASALVPVINATNSVVNVQKLNPAINAPLSLVINKSNKIATNPNHLEYVSASIHRSIYLSGKRAGLSSKAISQFMGIFQETLSFAKDVHDGDRFTLLYKQVPVVTKTSHTIVKKLKHGRYKKQVVTSSITNSSNEIVAAEIITRKKVYRAIRFTDSSGHADYYTPAGVTLKPAFIRAPAHYTHIGSKFSLHRWHPILHFYRAHLGVDFAAPAGTPLVATANGRIAFRGWKGGYGNAVLIQHDNKYSTFYAHLSRFAKNVKEGTYVHQNQLIGYIGATGLATAPHVHYEFRVFGVQHDPLAVRLPHLSVAGHANRAKFFTLARTLLAKLDNHLPQYAVKNLSTQQVSKA